MLDDRLKELPKCLFSDLPPIFKPAGEEGFIIYTPCENGIDDGGGRQPDIQEGNTAFQVIYRSAGAREARP